MYSEPNLHSRNLKLISMFFICYWLLGLTPADTEVRLLVINYKVSNPEALKWISYSLLIYFAWRFFVSSRRRVRAGYRKSFNFSQLKRSGWFFRKLKKDAEKDYEEKHKNEFEKWRIEHAKKHNVSKISNDEYLVNPIDLVYEQNLLIMHYQVRYEGNRLPGNDFKNGTLFYPWYSWTLVKLMRFTKFMLSTEDAPDYLIPWILFFLAIGSIILSHYGITVRDFG